MPIFTSHRLKPGLALLAGCVLAAPLASAASQCQGLQESACVVAEECLWVNGYVRKDGRNVASHCKGRGGKKAAAEAAADTTRLSKTR